MNEIQEVQYFDFHKKEAQAERDAVQFVCGYSFSDCLRIHRIKPNITVLVEDRKGKTTRETIEAHKIYGAWKDYLKATGQVTGDTITIITESGKEKTEPVVIMPRILSINTHIEDMYNWLTINHTVRYKAIKTQADKDWLKTIIRMVVLRRIMENKYERHRDTGDGFIDQKVYERIYSIYSVYKAQEKFAETSYRGSYNGVSKAIQEYEQISDELKQELKQELAKEVAKEVVKELFPVIEQMTKLLVHNEKRQVYSDQGRRGSQ